MNGGTARTRRTAVVVLAAAVTMLVASVVAAPRIVRSWADAGFGTTAAASGSPIQQLPAAGLPYGGMMNGARGMGGTSGMMSGRIWLAGDGVPVTSIAAARARADRAAAAAGLHPGEVIQFTRNFYVELKDAAGASVTEVLVDPVIGAVSTEPGPAMMWNTGTRSASVSHEQATSAATSWLRANRPGETVASVDAYPGYYTADTMNGTPAGMLSVNATTGTVWYHTWHGSFVAEEDS